MEHKGYDGNNGDCHKAVQGSMYSNAHKCNCTAVYLRLRSQVIQNIQKVNSNDAMQSNGCQELRKVMEIELTTLKSLQNLK